MELTIAGDGKLFDDLKKLIKKKGLNNIMRLAGRIDPQQMPDVYRQHDIFVTASMQEGMSNAMLEAAASGLPIITTRCEGVEELVTDNGVVVEDASAGALAEAISNLSENQDKYKAMSLAARRLAEKLGWDKITDQYCEIYRRICGKNK
jgi:glycosyltransferase involved in cell wall biosynthesis